MPDASIFTTQLYKPTNAGDGADIQIKVGDGSGDLEFAVHRAGAVDQILGPDGWQSSDYWFVNKNVAVTDGTAWVHLPQAIVEHITYSNYRLLARLGNGGEVRKGILSGGDLIARADLPSVNQGVELPPLPSGMEPSAASVSAVTAPEAKAEMDAAGQTFAQPDISAPPRRVNRALVVGLLFALLLLAVAWWLFSRSPAAVPTVARESSSQISIDSSPDISVLAPSQSESPKPEPVKPEPVKPEPAKPEPAKPEPAKPEPSKPAPNETPSVAPTSSPMNKLMIDLLK